MKNYVKCLGIIALVAAIGLFAACGGEDQNPAKTIKVTGIPAEYLKASTYIDLSDVSGQYEFIVAVGDIQISGSTGTFNLYIPENPNSYPPAPSNIRWTGEGTFNVHLVPRGHYIYVDDFEIKDAVTTIPYSRFTIWN